MTDQTVVTTPDEGPLRIPLKWSRPVFSADDGIGEMDSLSVMDGLALAFGFIDDSGANSYGSGIMVAPGLLVTATHVAEATRGTAGMAYSFLPDGRMRLWAPQQVHFCFGPMEHPLPTAELRRRVSDVCLVSCTLMSEQAEEYPLNMAHVEVAVPEIGQRLWAVGYRETARGDVRGMTMMCSSGLVTACLLDGRGNHLPGPCVEVAMNTLGGMSGGPVFNHEGHVIGIVSSSYESDDQSGPTYVSLIWPAIVGTVDAPWPKDFWPNSEANLHIARELGHARVHGDVQIDEDGVFTVRLPSADEKR